MTDRVEYRDGERASVTRGSTAPQDAASTLDDAARADRDGSTIDEPAFDEPAFDEPAFDEPAFGDSSFGDRETSAPDETPASGPPGRWRSFRTGLAEGWFPDPAGRRDPVAASIVLTIALAALAFFRVPWPAAAQRVWAEDGAIFLHDADQQGFGSTLFTQYAGYLHVVPRTVAAIVTLLPLAQWGTGVTVATAVIVGVLGMFAFVVMRDLTGRRWIGIAAAIYLVASPVGDETIGNLANLQWRLLPAAALVALWTPRRGWGAAVGALLLLAATSSTPFGVIVVAVVVIRLVVRPSRVGLAFAAGAVVGTAAQLLVILNAPTRPRAAVPGAYEMAQRYVLRVVGNGVYSERFFDQIPIRAALHAGELTAAVIGALLLIMMVAGGRAVTLRVLAFVAISLATFLGPMLISAPPFIYQYATRYYLAPAIFLMFSLLVAIPPRAVRRAHGEPSPGRRVERSEDRVRGGWTSWWNGSGSRAVAPVSAVAAVAMIAVAFAALQLPHAFPYAPLSRWDRSVVAARAQCAANPSAGALGSTGSVALSPPGWMVELPCAELR